MEVVSSLQPVDVSRLAMNGGVQGRNKVFRSKILLDKSLLTST